MIDIAIGVLYFLIGLIVLAGIIYLAIWVIESFIHPIPERVKQGIWVIVLLLALIYLLTVLAGGGKSPFPSLRGKSGGAPITVSAETTRHLQGVLT